jgi:[acyl-carrier-protein] S-malonyltransferase
VRWTQSVRLLASLGVTKFIEVGAGQVLSGLVRSIDSSLVGARFGAPADMDSAKALVG